MDHDAGRVEAIGRFTIECDPPIGAKHLLGEVCHDAFE